MNYTRHFTVDAGEEETEVTYGSYLEGSSSNTISGNNASVCIYGFYLNVCSSNTLSRNNVDSRSCDFYLYRGSLASLFDRDDSILSEIHSGVKQIVA